MAPMTRDHKIRLICSGLKGKERENTIMALLTDPRKIEAAFIRRCDYPWRSGARKPRPSRTPKDVNISIRLTYPQYSALKARASAAKWTITKLICHHLDLEIL